MSSFDSVSGSGSDSESDSDSDSQPRCIDSSLCEIKKRTELLAKKKVVLELYSCFLSGWTYYPGDEERKLDKMIVVKLLEHLDTKDVDDRTYVQSLLLRIYIKFKYLREFILKQFNDVFNRFTFESIECHCITELLDIYYDIIKDYSAPLKTNEEQVLLKVLLPLHKPQSMPSYFSTLIYCIIEFLQSNPSLIQRYVTGFLRLWPKTAYDKETLFLTEIASILVIQNEEEVTKVLEPAFKQIAKCLSSQSAKIAEQTLNLWEDEDLLELMRENNEVIMPIIFPSLYFMKKMHLSQRIQELVSTVMKELLMMNRELFLSLTIEQIRAEQKKTEPSNPP
ncbi:serine/threonine-protein phosphatase 2A 56 kDa regulatory subunit epsilon isoform [Drosophila yakuba]|uniref:Uncharacterized protein n=1 Tax=Drosophila yakuba TaxID=7245 RepID=B4Q1U8_DROYA|nr:serine/threonine-protein phosphatase 2A 56 kDa regulatory subunit epsilon isoform [Drosophila yakuba]EDX02523.2 uncharacterized protein Dyak_GE17620 [Drosophila yakuba]